MLAQVCAYHSALPQRNSEEVLRNGSKSQKSGNHTKICLHSRVSTSLCLWKPGNLWLSAIETESSSLEEATGPGKACDCVDTETPAELRPLALRRLNPYRAAFSQFHQHPSGSIKMIPRGVKDSDILLSSDLRVIFPIDQVPF